MKTSGFFIGLLLLIPTVITANTLIVDQNGTGSYTSIQEAIVNANAGDTVLVYPGDYIEIVDFLGKDIVVGSLFLTTQDTSYVSQTVIDGNFENLRLVRFTNGETNNAVLTGFTVTRAYGADNDYISGLGIFIDNSSPVIRNNRIVNNYYDSWYAEGGGIVLLNSSAKIIDNLISNNDMAYMGGGIYIKYCINLLIENNIITNNTVFSGYGVSYGAGIYIDSSSFLTIRNNIISENDFNNAGNGGGIYIDESENIEIVNNSISGNGFWGKEGGAVFTISSNNIYLIGNLFYENKADWNGAGICCYTSDIVLVNNTIANNEAGADYGLGGGIYCNNSTPEIINSILYSNEAGVSGNQVYLDENSDPDFYYCDVEGGLAAFGMNDTVVYEGVYENNIEDNPLFQLSGDYPYWLSEGSPCINAGNPDTAGLAIPDFDLAGNLRIIQDTIDIGAYEYQFPAGVNNDEISREFLLFPNPAGGMVTIYLPGMQSRNATATITDLKGDVMTSLQIRNQMVKCDLSALPKGIYLVKIVNGSFVMTKKLMHY